MHDIAARPELGRTTLVGSPRGPQRILIVEDEQLVALDLQLLLEDMGYIVVGSAASSDDARRIARDEHPDLVLMDVRLEGHLDGIQTGALIRSQHRIPIVYLTGNADEGTLSRALETEPDGYLAKPFQAATLRATIEVALRRHTAQLMTHHVHREEREHLEQRSNELHEVATRLRREATIDPLTGLYNRRKLDASIAEQLGRAERIGLGFGVVLLDLDRFKQLNDRFGHQAGDTVLHDVSSFLRDCLRSDDVACRYGGEEIAIVVAGASLLDTASLAERLRASIAKRSISIDGTAISVTASFGVAAYPDHGADAASLIRAADGALYAAKAAGRNCVVTARRS